MSNEFARELFQSAEDFVKRWIQLYDVVFYCQDYFNSEDLHDNMRNKVLNIQKEVDIQTQQEYENAGVRLEKVPIGLSGIERAKYVVDVIENGNIEQSTLEPLVPWSNTLPADCYSKRRS